MPKSLKVGNFAIDLESESKTWDEKSTPIYSSRVKISMPSCQNKDEKVHMSVLETPNNRLSPCKRTEKITFLTPDSLGKLQEQRKKGLPFYAGLFPAGKLAAYTCKSNLNPSSLIQVGFSVEIKFLLVFLNFSCGISNSLGTVVATISAVHENQALQIGWTKFGK